MPYPTEHIRQALAAEDAEAVENFCKFVVCIRGMYTYPESVQRAFTEFLRLLREIHT